jgi:dolichol kinase
MNASLIDKVFEKHYLRKIYHFCGGGLLILGLVWLDQSWFVLLDALYILAFLIFGKRISFAAIGVMFLLVLSGSKAITLGATVIWVVGDGLAGLLGAAYGKKKWPWNSQKSILGSVSFLAGSYLAMLVFLNLAGEIQESAYRLWLLAPCLVAAIVETLPISFIRDRKPDDNLTIILATGLVLWMISYLQ